MSTPRPATYVVGIGASAGGLQALESFFDHVPKDPGMAFVIVQHLSPDFKSVMDELLGRRTELPILHAENGMLVEDNHVYLNPPKKDMIISEGRLLLSDRERQGDLSLPIDVFFRSLAQDCGARGVAVVLSGGGSDGSRGIRDVHEAGGLVMVQDVDSAQFDGMPRSSREAGVAAHVLPPQEMPAVLVEHATRSAAASVDLGGGRAAPQGLTAVYRMLEDEFGIDFTHYKPSTITRRIERRLQLARAGSIEDYVERLRDGREELDVLYRDLLIGVTRFFRDEEAFDLLEQRILPDLLARGSNDDAPFRVWVAGCATGEEAYSIAILLQELSSRIGGRQVKIFATDVHRGSIEAAARGFYDEQALAGVSRARLERYFLRHGSSYQVVPELREMIVFASHNVIKDAPFTRVDLITCRNMLIYLQPAAQQKALSLFHFALNRGGLVFLGPSESPGSLAHDFETVDAHWKIYRKYSDARVPVDTRLQPSKGGESRFGAPVPGTLGRYSLSQLLGTYDTLLADVMPPSLLVTDRGELAHSFAGASRFLRPHDGRQGLDVVNLVDAQLKMVLVGGLQRARKERAPIVFTGVRVAEADGEHVYRVTIRPVPGKNGAIPHLLVSFEGMEPRPVLPTTGEPSAEIDVSEASREQLGALEAELSHTKENLEAAIEELQTSNEELQAANEELLASNEELQSTNEELQSVNEELYTVNAEYQRKITELTELSNDVDNLLASTQIGTIFLDTELCIRKFTPQIAESFHLLPQDVSRPIDSFTHDVDHPELMGDLRQVLASGEPIERELRDRLGRAFFLRILPYRAKGVVDGVVLTLIDVTGLKAAEDALFHERYLLNSLLATVPDAIYFKDASGRLLRANDAMAKRLGLARASEAVGKTPFELPDRDEAMALHREDEEVLRSGRPEHYRLERRMREGAKEEWSVVTRLPLTDEKDRVVGVIGIFRNVTEQKQAEQKVHEEVRRRDEFLAMLSHELRNPLNAIVTATQLLGEEKGDRAAVLRILERQAHQMARLLDDLLEASRVTQNKIELRRSVVDLRTVVGDAADAVRNLMKSRGLTFDVDVDESSLPVDGDAARLQQIQVNLLSNAAKYTPHGGHVHLDARRKDGRVVLRVKDDGAGIPKEMLDEVFDLFVQSRRTLDRSDGGLGVGLTLVRSLVTMHGGTVSVRSDGEGKGSEFLVDLPLTSGSQAKKTQQAPRCLDLHPGAKVVVVEDNPDSREMLCEILTRAGFDCHTAATGPEGLELIDRIAPDVAILDLGLPEMDGFELARRLRKNPAHAKMCLLALTGYGQPQDRAAALDVGFDEHVVKPILPADLLRILRPDKR